MWPSQNIWTLINTMKLILHLIILIYSQLKNQWHHLWTRHIFFRKVTVWTTKLNIVIKNKRYRRTWSWELLFMTRISMIKFEYSKKATKFEKKIPILFEITYLSQVFQLSSFSLFSTNQNAWQFCILIGRTCQTQKKLESWWAENFEMASALVK